MMYGSDTNYHNPNSRSQGASRDQQQGYGGGSHNQGDGGYGGRGGGGYGEPGRGGGGYRGYGQGGGGGYGGYGQGVGGRGGQAGGCSHDGGTNVLGQTPLDYGQVSPRGGGGGVVGDTTFQRGGAGYTSPGDQPGNNTDRSQRGGYDPYGRRQQKEQREDPADKDIPTERDLNQMEPARYNVDESLSIILETMSQRKDRYGNPVGRLGLKQLRKKFQLFDDTKEERDEGRAMLNWNEFFTGINDQQGFVRDPKKKLNKREIFNIFQHCDIDGSGNLDIKEFMFNIINVCLPPSCKQNVEVVFDAMDTDNSGFIEVKEIKRLYRVDQNPEVQNGKKTEAEAFADYISSFEPDFLNRQENEKDSRISHEEWMDYYCGIFREYAAAYGKNPAINAFNTLVKTTYRDTGKKTRDAFGEGLTYQKMNQMKGAALQY